MQSLSQECAWERLCAFIGHRSYMDCLRALLVFPLDQADRSNGPILCSGEICPHDGSCLSARKPKGYPGIVAYFTLSNPTPHRHLRLVVRVFFAPRVNCPQAQGRNLLLRGSTAIDRNIHCPGSDCDRPATAMGRSVGSSKTSFLWRLRRVFARPCQCRHTYPDGCGIRNRCPLAKPRVRRRLQPQSRPWDGRYTPTTTRVPGKGVHGNIDGTLYVLFRRFRLRTRLAADAAEVTPRAAHRRLWE